jgi:hypothetical protein
MENNTFVKIDKTTVRLESIDQVYDGWDEYSWIPIMVITLKNGETLRLENTEMIDKFRSWFNQFVTVI